MLGRIKTILPDKVSELEKEEGLESEIRSFSPLDVKDMVVEHIPSTLATITYVDNAVTGLATETYVDNSVLGLATTTYVDNAVSGAGVDWSQTQTSPVTDSASAVAFDFDTSTDWTLGKLLSLKSDGDERFYVDNRGITYGKNWSSGTYSIDPYVSNARIEFTPVTSSASVNIGRGIGRELQISAPSQYEIVLGAVTAANGMTIRPNAQTTDSVASPLKLKGGDPKSSATTNQDGGNLILSGGDAVGAGKKGVVTIENHITLGDDRTTNHSIVLSGLLETNKDATGAISWTLPTGATRGFHGEIRRVEDQNISLVAPSGVEMVYDGSLLAAGSTITLTHGYKGLSYKAVSSTLWLVDTVTNVSTGFVDYNHDAAAINLVAATWTDVPNNGAGLFTNETFSPFTDSLLDTATGYLDFTELPLGSEILIRSDFTVNPQVNNSLLEARYVLGTGAGEYALQFLSERLDNGSGVDYSRVLPFPIYMGDTNTRDNPGKLQVRLSTTGTLQNNGFYISIRGN